MDLELGSKRFVKRDGFPDARTSHNASSLHMDQGSKLALVQDSKQVLELVLGSKQVPVLVQVLGSKQVPVLVQVLGSKQEPVQVLGSKQVAAQVHKQVRELGSS